MKKLMFALIAGVAATAAQAVDVFADGEGFEGFALGAGVTSAPKFAYAQSNSSEDGSYVTNDTPYTTGTHAKFFETNGVTNAKYLNLSTDGGTLYRSINPPTSGNSVGEPRNIDSSFYIDTLVQFTVCDSAPTIDNGAKLAIWLQASDNETTTNLMVQAKVWSVAALGANAAGFEVAGTNDFVLSGNYEAGQWYRLTVEAVPNLLNNGKYLTGFKVKINGTAVQATGGECCFVLADGESETLATLLGRHAAAADVTAMTSGYVFASLADQSADVSTTPSIAAVGFSGTGLVDEILFTDYDPDEVPVDVFDFTITFNTGVSAVSYAFGTSNGTAYAETTLTALPAGTVVTLSGLTGSGVSGWDVQEAALVDAANCSTNGLEVTLDGTVGTPASVTVGLAAKTVVDADITSANLTALGITQPALVSYINGTAANFTTLKNWAAANAYSVARVNAYPYAVERMTANLPIETTLRVRWDGTYVTNDETESPLTFAKDAESAAASGDDQVDYDGHFATFNIDAGFGVTVSGMTYASGFELETDTSAEGWNATNATVAVNAGAVKFTAALDSDAGDNKAQAYIATKSSAPATYDFTVTFASPVSGVSYVIGEAAAQSATSGVAIPVTVGSSITLTPAASSLDMPMFYTVTSDVTNYFTTLTFNAAGSVTIYAADASTASGEAAEAAATNVVAAAAAAAGADGAAVAAKVEAAAAADGVTVANTAAWLESKTAGGTVTYAQVASADADDVAAAVGFDLGELVAGPKVEITAVGDDTVNSGADAAYALTFKVTNQAGTKKDIGSAVVDYVKSLVKMTSDLSDWDGSSKITEFDVEVSVNGDGTATAKVEKPAATTAFMKIGE